MAPRGPFFMEVVGMEKHCSEHSGLVSTVSNLVRWQENQNGSLRDLRKEIASLRTWIMTTLATALLSVALLAFNLALGR